MDSAGKNDLENFSMRANLREGKLPKALREVEKQMILEAMLRSDGNQRMASELLGITQRMLGYRLKRYGL